MQASILVADDDPCFLRFISHVLRGMGDQVSVAADGVDAFRSCNQNETVDLLLTDVHMPHMNRPELALCLRRGRPGVPVLFFTKNSSLRILLVSADLRIPVGRRIGEELTLPAEGRIASSWILMPRRGPVATGIADKLFVWFNELREQSQAVLLQFLNTDLNVAATLLQTARMETELHLERVPRLLSEVRQAVRTIRSFSERLADRAVGEEIRHRTGVLEGKLKAFEA